MDDKTIVELYWQRDEKALTETELKYGKYLAKIAKNILADARECEECVNDTYLQAWNSMPQNRPDNLGSFLAKIIRGLSVDVIRKRTALKRRPSEYVSSLSELEECVGGGDTTVLSAEGAELAVCIGCFLRSQSREVRTMFICRYYFCDSLNDIASFSGVSIGKVKTVLYRTRCKLKEYLLKEGFEV